MIRISLLLVAFSVACTTSPSPSTQDLTSAPSDMAMATTGDMKMVSTACHTAGCRAFSIYCSTNACQCVALIADNPDPPCAGMMVSCLVDPCEGKTATCDHGTGKCAIQ